MAPPRPVTIKTGIARVSNGRVSIVVSCPATAPANCVGSLSLLTAKGVRVGRTSYNVRRGATATLKLRLTRNSRRLADRNGHLRVLARASTAVSGSAAQNERRLTLVLRRTHQERQR
jgi:hypothetical protein